MPQLCKCKKTREQVKPSKMELEPDFEIPNKESSQQETLAEFIAQKFRCPTQPSNQLKRPYLKILKPKESNKCTSKSSKAKDDILQKPMFDLEQYNLKKQHDQSIMEILQAPGLQQHINFKVKKTADPDIEKKILSKYISKVLHRVRGFFKYIF